MDYKPSISFLRVSNGICSSLRGQTLMSRRRNSFLFTALSHIDPEVPSGHHQPLKRILGSMLQDLYFREGSDGLYRELSTQRLGLDFRTGGFTIMHHVCTTVKDNRGLLSWLLSKLGIDKFISLLLLTPTDTGGMNCLESIFSDLSISHPVDSLCTILGVLDLHDKGEYGHLKSNISSILSAHLPSLSRTERYLGRALYDLHHLLPGCLPDMSHDLISVKRILCSYGGGGDLDKSLFVSRELLPSEDSRRQLMSDCIVKIMKKLTCHRNWDDSTLEQKMECMNIIVFDMYGGCVNDVTRSSLMSSVSNLWEHDFFHDFLKSKGDWGVNFVRDVIVTTSEWHHLSHIVKYLKHLESTSPSSILPHSIRKSFCEKVLSMWNLRVTYDTNCDDDGNASILDDVCVLARRIDGIVSVPMHSKSILELLKWGRSSLVKMCTLEDEDEDDGCDEDGDGGLARVAVLAALEKVKGRKV